MSKLLRLHAIWFLTSALATSEGKLFPVSFFDKDKDNIKDSFQNIALIPPPPPNPVPFKSRKIIKVQKLKMRQLFWYVQESLRPRVWCAELT